MKNPNDSYWTSGSDVHLPEYESPLGIARDATIRKDVDGGAGRHLGLQPSLTPSNPSGAGRVEGTHASNASPITPSNLIEHEGKKWVQALTPAERTTLLDRRFKKRWRLFNRRKGD